MPKMTKNFIFKKIPPEQIMEEAKIHASKKLENFIKNNEDFGFNNHSDYEHYSVHIEKCPFTEYLIEMDLGYQSGAFPDSYSLYYCEIIPYEYYFNGIFEYNEEYIEAFINILSSYGITVTKLKYRLT